MKSKIILLTFLLSANLSFGQNTDTTFRKNFVGSSLFMLANLLPEPPLFFQLNYGRWLTEKDVVSVEAISWKYLAPLGIPYGPSYENPEAYFPGHVRAYGLAIAYQRYVWKGFYSALHAANMRQHYISENGERLGTGFQLFMTLRFGHHFKLWHNRFFIEPSIAFTSWPINTNLPESFQQQEDKWSKYFLFEPGLHFGFKF